MNTEIQETEKLQLGDPELSALQMMKELAKNNTALAINGDEQREHTKMFYIMYAKHNLNRIIKLTMFLEKLEDKFIMAVDEIIEKQPESVAMISTAMETISNLLKDCNAVVKDVLKDDKLTNLTINTTNIITPEGGSATIIDANSRDEIRNAAASLLSQLEKMQLNVADSQVVESTATEEKDDENV